MREAERISSLRKVFVLKNGKREFPETKCGILPCSVLSNDMNAFDEETARLHKSAALMFTISPVSPAAQKKKKSGKTPSPILSVHYCIPAVVHHRLGVRVSLAGSYSCHAAVAAGRMARTIFRPVGRLI